MVGGMGIAAGSVGGAAGVATVGRFMPAIGSTMMMGEVVRHTSKLVPKTKKRRKK